MARDFVQQNEASRQELRELVSRLDARGFEHAVEHGWTVSTLLCHLAFWDQRTLFLLKEWQAGRFDATRMTEQAVHSVNEAVKAVSQAVPGAAAGKLVLESAAAVDAELEKIGDDLVDRMRSSGFERMLNRSLHRREHLTRIEKALGWLPKG